MGLVQSGILCFLLKDTLKELMSLVEVLNPLRIV